jgi:hypothetical protein
MNTFLNELKDALENGEFNSDVAKNINEVTEATEKKLATTSIDEITAKFEKIKGEPVSREVAEQKNAEFEVALKKQKERDNVLSQIARVYVAEEEVNFLQIEINDLIEVRNNYIKSMLSYIESIKDLLENDGIDFKEAVNEIKNKYIS